MAQPFWAFTGFWSFTCHTHPEPAGGEGSDLGLLFPLPWGICGPLPRVTGTQEAVISSPWSGEASRRPVPNCVQKGSSHLAGVRWRKAIQGRGLCVQRQETRVDLVGGLENIWCGWSSEVGGRKSGGQGQRGWQPFIPGAFPAKVKHISALAPEASVCYVVCLMPRFPRFVLHVGYFAV